MDETLGICAALTVLALWWAAAAVLGRRAALDVRRLVVRVTVDVRPLMEALERARTRTRLDAPDREGARGAVLAGLDRPGRAVRAGHAAGGEGRQAMSEATDRQLIEDIERMRDQARLGQRRAPRGSVEAFAWKSAVQSLTEARKSLGVALYLAEGRKAGEE